MTPWFHIQDIKMNICYYVVKSQTGRLTCSVLQVKSDCSSPQTLSAATTSTMTRKMNSTESHTLPKLVEWRFAPTNWAYRAGQDILGTQSDTWGWGCNNMTAVSSRNGIFLYQARLVPLNHTSDSGTDGNSEGRQWHRMKAETGDGTKEKFERRRGWKGMKVRGGGETAQRQHSCELMNLSTHCGLYWTKPTQLKTHWTHCINPHYYSPHWASPFTVSDWLTDWLVHWLFKWLIYDMHDICVFILSNL